MNAQRKISRPLSILAACMLVALLSVASAEAQNVSVVDYEVPVSRADNLRIGALSFNLTTAGNEIITEQGNVGLVYKKFYSSLPFAYSIDAVGSASYIRELESTPNRDGTYDSHRNGTYEYSVDMRVQKYFLRTNEFFYSISPDILDSRAFERPQIDVVVGLGYGRFINATALRKAVRIEDFLFKEGVISDRMPKDTMINLGHTIQKENEYRDLYGDRSYQNYWYEDMTNEINKTELVTGGGNIGPIGIFRMREVLTQEQISDRFFGWDANVGLQYQIQTQAEAIKRPPLALAVSLRYSRPISWRMQINTRFIVDTPFEDLGRVYNARQNIDFIYEITNKIAFVTSNTFYFEKKAQQELRARYVSNISFTFFVENKISLSIIEQLSKNQGTPFRQSLHLGLNYRIF